MKPIIFLSNLYVSSPLPPIVKRRELGFDVNIDQHLNEEEIIKFTINTTLMCKVTWGKNTKKILSLIYFNNNIPHPNVAVQGNIANNDVPKHKKQRSSAKQKANVKTTTNTSLKYCTQDIVKF